MTFLRRPGALLLLLAVSAFSTLPVAALRCESRKACPMMAKRGVPCHGSSSAAAERAGMTTPMSCCETRATTSPTGTLAWSTPPVRFAMQLLPARAAADVARGGSLRLSLALDRLALHGIRRV